MDHDKVPSRRLPVHDVGEWLVTLLLYGTSNGDQ
jgi:hypothetical protein